MPKRRKYELIQCRYFRWRLKSRNGIWHADGRSNETNLGRHSLGTRDVSEAKQRLQELDLVKAVEHGLANSSQLDQIPDAPLSLEKGRLSYEQHVSRPQIVGGARPKTVQRYKAVLDKFLPFALKNGIRCWNDVDGRLLEKYAKHLEKEEYAYRTIYLELNTVKQIVKWLIRQGHLKGKSPIDLPVEKSGWNPHVLLACGRSGSHGEMVCKPFRIGLVESHHYCPGLHRTSHLGTRILTMDRLGSRE